jgi:hypothetical protein
VWVHISLWWIVFEHERFVFLKCLCAVVVCVFVVVVWCLWFGLAAVRWIFGVLLVRSGWGFG